MVNSCISRFKHRNKSIAKIFLVAAIFWGLGSYSSFCLAENWRIGYQDSVSSLSLDIDSISPANLDGVINARWKHELKLLGTYTYSGYIHCKKYAMMPENGSYFDKIRDKSVVVPKMEMLDKYLWFPGTHTASIVQMACEIGSPQSLISLTHRRDEDCKDKSDFISQQLCRRDDIYRGNFSLLIDRRSDLVYECGQNFDDYRAVIVEILRGVHQCKDDKCANEQLSGALSFISNDLESAQKWRIKNPDRSLSPPADTCRMVSVYKQRGAEQQANEAAKVALGDYRKCIDSNISKVDDQVSSAEIIAKGLRSFCSSHLERAIDISATFKSPEWKVSFLKEIEPYMIEKILAARVARKVNATKK